MELNTSKIIKALEGGKLSTKEIANKFGCDVGQVHRIAKDNDIKARNVVIIEKEHSITLHDKIRFARNMIEYHGNTNKALKATEDVLGYAFNEIPVLYHPNYSMIPEDFDPNTRVYRVLVAIMVFNPPNRDNYYEAIKADKEFGKSWLKDVNSSNSSTAIDFLRSKGIINEDYLVTEHPKTIRAKNLLPSDIKMMIEAEKDGMTNTEIAEMFGSSVGFIGTVKNSSMYIRAKERLEKSVARQNSENQSENPVDNKNEWTEFEFKVPETTDVEELKRTAAHIDKVIQKKLEEVNKLEDIAKKINEKISSLTQKAELEKKLAALDSERENLLKQLNSL